MRRSLVTVLAVAMISAGISAGEHAVGSASQDHWVRTADGWEPRHMLAAHEAASPPALHPLVVAALQLGASLFALIAFPSPVRALGEATARGTLDGRVRRRRVGPTTVRARA